MVATLAGMGLFTLYSIEMQGLRDISLFIPSIIYAVMGLVLLLGITFFDYRKLKSYGLYLFAGTMLIWLMLLLLGKTIVDNKPYLNLGFISIDYISITPVLLTIALASILLNKDWSKGNWFVVPLLLLSIPNVFYITSNSITTAVIYTAVFLILMSVSGARKKQLMITGIIPFVLFTFDLLRQPWNWDRMLAFINPYNDPMGSGYIYIQSMETILSAGFWGQGLSFSGNLPEVHTDLIFSYIVYTFGWVGGGVVVILALALIAMMMGVAMQVKDHFGRLLVSGLTSIVALHFMWNILMAFGFAPISGVSLPFFSYGGSHAIINMVIIGLILSVYRRKNLLANPIYMISEEKYLRQ